MKTNDSSLHKLNIDPELQKIADGHLEDLQVDDDDHHPTPWGLDRLKNPIDSVELRANYVWLGHKWGRGASCTSGQFFVTALAKSCTRPMKEGAGLPLRAQSVG